MKTILKHISYDLYLIGLITLTFISFMGPLEEYLMPLLVGIGFLFILANKSIFYVIPIPFFVQMSFGGMRDNVQVTTIYTIIFVLMIAVDMIKNRTITNKGKLTIPLAILVGLSVLTHFNSPDLFTTFAGFMQIASVLGLYFYFINTLQSSDDNYRYVAKLMMYMSVLVSMQMMYVIYDSGELATTIIRTRTIDLGWENLNIIIYSNLISIPLIAYLIHESKIKIFYMIFAVVSMIGIFLTLSRSSVLTLGVMVALIIPTMFILSKQKGYLIGQGFVLILMLLIVAYITEQRFELLSGYIDAFEQRDLYAVDDRIELLYVAWNQLKQHPLFGSGGLYSSRIHLANAGFQAVNYHNTMAQASTLGILGVIGFYYLFLEKTRLIMLSKSSFKWFVLIMVFTTAFVNGTLQPMYFYTTYMVFLFLVLASIEVSEMNDVRKSN
ncbi:O-antigen ligase family protein [Candidatus Xianfuyuplasma coldseepsis]|uniref:O-antigen ligase family protein n=1 Tax=Candidatus Xianfuyuplasma coldseepsis TaxID=2782163 RepID=A0A7L7KSC3_9MOLU|nr:O-antigen ligase family protein [Xianfuyuplasma coldseepsis]QMS85720.1 O-antigen ligase family protein [Xianfuyuplasma coldseepsis]